jgi:hypothetical protein
VTTVDPRIKTAHGLIEREDFARALPIVSELLNENPENPKAIYLAGWILRSQGHVGMALQMFRRALSLEPKVPNIWMHYGACLHDTHKYAEAREAFSFVGKALPDDPMPLANIAASFVQEGKARDAVEAADQSFALLEKWHGDPAAASRAKHIASVSKAFGCLALGRWADGWEYAESLYGDTLSIRVYRDPEEPTWDGSKGKTVVVQADQGLGDMIMFAQCLPEMVKECKKVIVETNARLAPLFRRNWPQIDVYDTLKDEAAEWPARYEIDAHIHISWLGRYYRKTDADFPRTAYLTADPERVEKWREFLQAYPKPWVGLAWRGGIQRTNSASRSLQLADLAPLIESGGAFFSLAYQQVGLEVARWNIEHPEQVICPELKNDGDYEHTLALIAALDHVVTVTTTAAHVCGALGKRAYVLVNQSPQWRYIKDCEGGLFWYPPTLQTYRQKPGETDWTHTIARVTKDYQAFVR